MVNTICSGIYLNGVLPWLSLASTSAPDRTRNRTMSAFPHWAAKWRGMTPLVSSFVLISNLAPAFISAFTVESRVASFAKFREMQKMFLRKKFRENWMQTFAKMVITDFDPFWARFSTIQSSNLDINWLASWNLQSGRHLVIEIQISN